MCNNDERDPTVDEFGMKYNDYPDCPKCGAIGRTGRNSFSREPYNDPNKWYCYSCCSTF